MMVTVGMTQENISKVAFSAVIPLFLTRCWRKHLSGQKSDSDRTEGEESKAILDSKDLFG